MCVCCAYLRYVISPLRALPCFGRLVRAIDGAFLFQCRGQATMPCDVFILQPSCHVRKKCCSEARSCVDASLAGDAAFIAATLLTPPGAQRNPLRAARFGVFQRASTAQSLARGRVLSPRSIFQCRARRNFRSRRHIGTSCQRPCAGAMYTHTLFSVQICGVWEFTPLECTLCGVGSSILMTSHDKGVRMGNQYSVLEFAELERKSGRPLGPFRVETCGSTHQARSITFNFNQRA